jgi:hypothetical protein
MAAWALYQLALGLYFIFLRPGLLPEDVRFAGASLDRLNAAAPRIELWLQWVFTVLGGQMAAVGLLVAAGSWMIWQGNRPERPDLVAFVGAGIFSLTLMSGVNFAIGSDFRWLLVAPVAIWLAALIALLRLRNV